MSRYSYPDPFPTPFRVEVAARSDIGKTRSNNEDKVAVCDAAGGRAWTAPAEATLAAVPGAFVAVVCDGMGGEAGGEVASHVAVETIVAEVQGWWSRAGEETALAAALVASIETASARVKAIGRMEPKLARMGTTATVAAIARGALLCAQVGDSRAYRLRGGVLDQLTVDQTLAEQIRQAGIVTADGFIGSNVILQAVGASHRLDVAVTRTELTIGDVVLLCSDGLHGVVPDDAIACILISHEDPGKACDALVDAANAGGGPDNVSCVVFRVLGRDA